MTLPASRRVTVLYDGDCGFCTHTAGVLRRLDGKHRLQLTPLQLAAETVPDAPPEDVLLDAMHVRDGAGHWSLGGAAWIRIAQEIPILRPLAFVARLPGIRRLVEPTYALVAGNRQRISRLLGDDACRVDQDRA